MFYSLISVFNSLKSLVFCEWCVLKKRNVTSENLKIYCLNMILVLKWSSTPMKFRNQHLHF